MAVVADTLIPEAERMAHCIHGMSHKRWCATCWLDLQRRYGLIQNGKGPRIIKPEELDEEEVLVPDEEPPLTEGEEEPDDYADEQGPRDPAEAALDKPRRRPRAARKPVEEELIPPELSDFELPKDGKGDAERDAVAESNIPIETDGNGDTKPKARINKKKPDAIPSAFPSTDPTLPPLLTPAEQKEKKRLANLPINMILEIPVTRIRFFRGQPRKYFNQRELERLGRSMKASGQKTPITVRWLPNDKRWFCELVDGERRVRSAEFTGILALRAIRIDVADEKQQFAVSAISNFGRLGHTALEIAEALEHMTRDCWTPRELAEAFGKTVGWVYQYLSFTRLTQKVRDLMDPELPDSKRLKFSMAMVLAHLESQLQERLAQEVMASGLRGARALQFIRQRARQEGARAEAPGRSPGEDFRLLNTTLQALQDRAAILNEMTPSQVEAMFASREPGVRDEVLRSLETIAQKIKEAQERFSPAKELSTPRG